MSLFGDLDIQSAADDPFKVDNGTYPFTITKVKSGPTSKGDKLGLTLEYTITDEDSPMNGRKVSEWKHIPQPDDPQNPTAEEARAASFLKLRLADLGVPENQMNSLEIEDLLGLEGVMVVKNNGEYTNVTKVTTGDPTDYGI